MANQIKIAWLPVWGFVSTQRKGFIWLQTYGTLIGTVFYKGKIIKGKHHYKQNVFFTNKL